jgi:hypothetical protein
MKTELNYPFAPAKAGQIAKRPARLTHAQAVALAKEAEGLFNRAAQAWIRGNNSGNSEYLEHSSKACDKLRAKGQTLLDPHGITADFPGLYPVFEVAGRQYHTILDALDAAEREV